MTKTKTIGLQERQDAPLILTTSEESLNSISLYAPQGDDYKSDCPLGSGCNVSNDGSMSARYFVLDVEGQPLTPCKASRIRKLLKGKQAIPIWNKFGKMGIQMLVKTRDKTQSSVLGIDNGTKYEGNSVIIGKENLLNVMWLLPDKKKLVKKLEERKQLRHARRWRQCGRRECRSDNRNKDGFIAPSQMLMINSRLKCLRELFKCYPIRKVATEDVRFNHAKHRWGKNFSTIEVGKNYMKSWLCERVGRENYLTFEGHETKAIRESLGLKKHGGKSNEIFETHCVDSYSIAQTVCKADVNRDIVVVDDTYRCCRRKLHKVQFEKGGIRRKESCGNFKAIRKGTISSAGLIGGGTGNNCYVYPIDEPIDKKNRRSKSINKIAWLSHKFKIKGGNLAIPPISEVNGLPCEDAS